MSIMKSAPSVVHALLALSVPLISSTALADCRTVVSEMMTIASRPGSFFNAHVSSSKAGPDRHHASHAYGYFGIQPGGSALTGQFRTAFSDRGYFSVAQQDVQQISFYAGGTADVVLVTWGNGRLPLQEMACTKDRFGFYISGKTLEGNGTTLYAMALKAGYLGFN